MDGRYRIPVAVLASMLLLAGCHTAPPVVTGPPLAECAEHRVEPQPIEPDVEPLARSHVDPAVTPAAAAGASFSQLFEVDSQCQAARVAPLADLVQLETQLASALANCQHGDAALALDLQCAILRLQMVEHRNNASAEALTAFYRLADVEGRAAKLRQMAVVLDEAIDRAERLHERGLLQNVSRSELRQQRLALAVRGKELDLARAQLNATLRVLLGCDPQNSPNYWPETSWTVKPTPVDETSALAVALAQRPDIRTLGLVLGNLSVATLPVARAVLSSTSAELGATQSRDDWLGELRCPDGTCDEVAVRRSQLVRLLEARRRAVAGEIHAAVAAIEATAQEVLLAERAVRSWNDRVSELRRTRDVADASVFEVAEAEGELLAAEAALIEKITALRLARLELREVQAVLPAECGLDSHVTAIELAAQPAR